ncbi:MAG: hypothetical protein ACYDGN_04690 [Acidimicrobiales bacterium]
MTRTPGKVEWLRQVDDPAQIPERAAANNRMPRSGPRGVPSWLPKISPAERT